jgi:hypothetical protein
MSRGEYTLKLVRIPRHLLHVQLDDLGLSENARGELRALLADLPLVPRASDSAILLGLPATTLPSLAVLARHVGQGLRDHNLSIAADRQRLRLEQRKLIFLDAEALEQALAWGEEQPSREAALFVTAPTPRVLELLAQREANGLVSFVTSTMPVAALASWRQIDLSS